MWSTTPSRSLASATKKPHPRKRGWGFVRQDDVALLPAAHGPLARARACVEHRRAPVLLGLRGRGGIALAAHGSPGRGVELVLAAVCAAPADRLRVAMRLALRDRLEL